jgi:hypothetical protein
MHLIAEIAVLLQSAPNHTDPHQPGWFLQDLKNFSNAVVKHWSDIAKVVVALATLLSTGGVLGGRFSWLQRFIAPKRKAELVEQIGKLAENMSKAAELPEWASEMNSDVRATLKAELEMKLAELKKLQAPATKVHSSHSGASSVRNWLKYTFLWWWPRGFGAWLLHLSYYLLMVVIGLMSLGFLVAVLTPDPKTHIGATDITLAIVLYAILGVPALVLRFFAARIYKHQCEERLRQCESVPA